MISQKTQKIFYLSFLRFSFSSCNICQYNVRTDLGIRVDLDFVTLLQFVNLFFKRKKTHGFKVLLDFFCSIFFINPLYPFQG